MSNIIGPIVSTPAPVSWAERFIRGRDKHREDTHPAFTGPARPPLRDESVPQVPQRQEVDIPVPVGPPTATGVPYKNWQIHRDYVTDDEKVRFTEEGIEKRYDQEINVEISRARMAGSPISREEALRRVMLKNVGGTVSPATGDVYLRPTDVKNRTPATSDDVKEYIALNYPSITRAAYESGLSEAEILRTANIMVARDAAVEIDNSMNPIRQAQIFNTMGPDMQDLVGTILQRMQESGEAAAQVVEDESAGNFVTDLGRTIWGYFIGPILDEAWEANRFTVNRAIPTAFAVGEGVFRGRDPIESFNKYFPATAPGVIDPAAIQIAKDTYGEKTVDTIVEVLNSKLSGEDDFVGKLYQKYYESGDTEALAILDNLLSGVPTDQQVQDAATYLYSAETGNFGNVFFWSITSLFGVDPYSEQGINIAQTPFYTGIRDVSNVTGTIVFDPLLVGGKIGNAYRGARYGLHKLGTSQGLENAFKDRNVRRAFDTLGIALRRVDNAKDQTIAAQMMNSINSQWGRWFTPDAIATMRAAGVRDADTAYDFFRSADNIGLMVQGQMARRGNKLFIPHMSKATAEVKLASMRARGLTYDRNAAKQIDALFDAPVSRMIPEEAHSYILSRLGSADGEKFLGRMTSDFLLGSEGARRTFLGKVFDAMIKRDPANPRIIRAMSRYGFKRKPGVRRFVERRARVMARMPNVSNISISTGTDAYKIRDLLLYAGMPKYWADYSAMVWRSMNPGERLQFSTGIARSVAYARGIDIVDPVRGKRIIDDLTSGFRPGELYAPDIQDVVALRGIAERMADNILSGTMRIEGRPLQADRFGLGVARQERDSAVRARQELLDSGVPKSDPAYAALNNQIKNLDDFLENAKVVSTKSEKAALVDDLLKELKADSPLFNPSRVADQGEDVTRGLYRSQFADQISLVNFEKLDELSMRQSYISAILGTNPFMTNATDFWTLGTLAGPRFQVRNGIEDAIFYGITGGSWKSYRWGQLVARARAEATPRKERGDRAALVEAGAAQVRGSQIGVVPTFTRWLGDIVPKSLNGLIQPHLNPAERLAAFEAGKTGNRQLLGELIQKATLRQRLLFLPAGASKNKQFIKDLDDIYDSGYFWGTYDDASEAARHLIDGILPGADNTMIINGQLVKTVTVGREFKTGKPNPDHVQSWWNNLTTVLHGDGNKGGKAVGMISRYYQAKRSGDPARVKAVVDEYADWIRANADWVESRSGIVASEGLSSFAQRNLDDVLRVFSTKSGTLNYELLKKVRRTTVDKDGNKKVTYALWDDVDGKQVYRLSENDLINMKGRPQSVLEMDGAKIPIMDKLPLNTRVWSMMGRSYARLTRQPMFIANYLDARQALRPIENRLAREISPEYARKWAVEASSDRAFNVLMSYVDNPNIRSQMAFNLRNVARFYRALEDFNRRVLRTVKNYPEGVQKLNIGYRVLDDTGFINQDEFGNKSFVWPGSKYSLWAMNQVTTMLGGPNIAPMTGMPISLTSSLTNLTPSADPDNWWPTTSGVYASAALRPLMRITPGLKSLEEELFGRMSVGQDAWLGALPTNLIRPLNYIMARAQGGTNEEGEINRWLLNDGAFASANRSAIEAAMAAGWIDPNKSYTREQLDTIRERIDRVGMDILLYRAVLGPIIPAAFGVQAETVSDFAKNLGISNMRSAFIQTLKAYDGDGSQALIAWMAANPDKSIFTVGSTTNARNMGYYAPFKETVQFIDDNKQLMDRHPIGAALFAPQVGEQTLSAWRYLRSMDVNVSKASNRYFNEMATSQGYALYRIYKKQYEDILATGTESEIEEAKESWDMAREDLNATYPLLDRRLRGRLTGTTRFSSASEYSDDVEDYRGAIKWFAENRKLDERGKAAQQVLDYHDEAKLQLSNMSTSDPNYNRQRADIRASWIRMAEDMKSRYPDDSSFDSLLFTTSGSLGFRLT